MNNLIFVQDEVSKEIEVVKEERRLRTDDQPVSKLFEKINNQIFGMTRYGIPIVGTMDDIGRIKISDLKEWYDNYYTPSNATVIIAGDIDFIKTKKMIEKHYGQIEDRKVIRSVDSINHKISYKDILVHDKVSQPIVLMSYKHEPFSDDNKKEMYALELLFELMDGSNSSRFTKNLVDKKKVAMNTFISFDTYSANDNLITLGGSPRSGISIDQFKNEMLNEFEVFVKNGLDEGELDRIKSRLLANNIYKFDSVFYQVMQVGMLETKGYNWELLDTYINDINNINEDDLKKIASKIILNKEYLYSSILPKS
jgi:zinc protease